MSSWARLVSLTSSETYLLDSATSKYTIGRLAANDLCLTGNQLVSSRHCFISKMDDGTVWIEDTSTNGTMVDGKKLKKGDREVLHNGSEIKIVFKGTGHATNIVLRFDDLCSKELEHTLEMTQEYDDETEENITESEEPKPKKSRVDGPSSTGAEDAMEESLQCGICREILHDCISLQPCMHSFCGGCYSQWMAQSKVCPQCRAKVDRISKNHIVNNLVGAYLKEHPEKKRSEDELEALNKQNKITQDMLYPKQRRGRSPNEDDEDDEEDDDESGDDYQPPFGFLQLRPGPAPPLKCRACPDYTGPHANSDGYLCPAPAVHLLCHCCMEPMPDRASAASGSRVPKQQCDICHQAYCHLYWTCNASNCSGCLGPFADISLADQHLNGIINDGNVHESDVLKDYLESNGLTIRDMLRQCARKVDSGEYSSSVFTRLTSDTVTCYRCCLKSVRELAYLYRRDIPNDGLPASVTARPDCYWGKNCRTQRNKPDHAKRFNHVCEQTRF